MRNQFAFHQFLTNVAKYYHVDPQTLLRGESFNLTVPAAALLGENIQQRSEFLQKINVMGVKDIKGHKLFGATEKAITGRRAQGRYRTTLDHTQAGYECVETDSGVILPWVMFDNFARFGNELSNLYAKFVQTQIALDMLQIGWHGKSVAKDTKATDLSDVNKGWLALLKQERASNVFSSGKTNNQIKVFGQNADHANLDRLAFDLRQCLDLRHQNRNDLVFLVGADLVSEQTKIIYDKVDNKATELAALKTHHLTGSFGGMPAMTPENFPAKGAVVTTLSNLSIYTQSDSVRRAFRNDEDLKGIVNSYYRQECYVVEDVGLMAAVDPENVVVGDSQAPAA